MMMPRHPHEVYADALRQAQAPGSPAMTLSDWLRRQRFEAHPKQLANEPRRRDPLERTTALSGIKDGSAAAEQVRDSR
jgi:hypothetical protein